MMDFLKQIKSVGFAILAVLTAHFGQSQSLSPQSISTQGGGHKSPNYQVNYTIGQVVQGGGATTGYRITNGLQNDYSGPPEIEVTSLGNQVIRVGSRLEFYVTPPASAPSATLSYQVAGSPFGQVAFDPATGLFSFTPDQQDTEPFYVSFFATDGVTVIEQKVQISTFPTLESVPGEDFGFTQGYFNVNEGGGATYVVPVKLPLGTGGMKPDLSMVYSSTGSNGILGVGWSLGGLSMISRSPATYEQDKLLDGVNFNENDRFNMDGERLVSIGGGVYGANGTEYRTESNNFSRVISFMENGVTSRFLVKTKSGLTYEYGFTKDSRIEAQGRQEVLFWAVNKIYDTNGNTISFLYEENNATGEFYPLRIEYAGNLNAGLAPAYKVQFEYEYRPDASEQYIYGSKVLKARRLKKIGVTAANTILREYLFKYKLDIRTKLVSIREIGSNGKSLRPVNFTWNDSLKFDLTQVENILPSVPNGYSVNPVDWNRDGFTDLMFYNKTNGDNIFYMNRGNLVFAEDAAYKLPASMIMQGNGISMGDWNGDAKTDLLWWNSADGTNRWFVNTGSGFELYNKVVVPSDQIRGGELHMGDWNGDALTDVMWYNKATGDNTWFFNLFGVSGNIDFEADYNGIFRDDITGGTSLYLNDWNGDGSTDVMWYDAVSGKNRWFLNQGRVQNKITFTVEKDKIRTSDLAGGGKIQFGDWNADGITDFLWYDNTTGNNNWFVSKGNGLFEYTQKNRLPASLLQNPNILLYLNDWNGDGFTDLLVSDYSTGANTWFVNKGAFNFHKETNLIVPDLVKLGSGLVFGDWNGKGVNSFLFFDPATGANRVFINNIKNSNLIAGIREGNGYAVNIQYSTLLDTAVYKMGKDAVYPDIDFTGPVSVVKSYESSDGIGGMKSFGYAYENGKMHVLGRGFRGFAKTIVSNNQTGLKSVSYYERNYQYLGNELVRSEQILPDGSLLAEADFINEYLDIEGNGTFFSYVKEKAEKSYEFGGKLVAQKVLRNNYDKYGNLTSAVVDYKDGHRDSTVSVFFNDADAWLLGRLTRMELHRKRPSTVYTKRTSAFEYDVVTGLLIKEISEPDIDTLRLTKEYILDKFGNRAGVITSGFDGEKEKTIQSTATFDPTGRYAVENVNQAGHMEQRRYDGTWGNVISHKGINGLETLWEYDAFGRKVRQQNPDGTELVKTMKWCDGGNCPPLAVYYLHTQNSGSPPSTTYFDLMGREVRSVTLGFDGQSVVVDKEYDIHGNIARESDPYFEGQTPLYTVYTYDVLNRRTSLEQPGGRITQVQYDGTTTTYINPLGQKKTETTNAMGRMVSVIDHLGSVLTYGYDNFGNPVTIQDPKGNVIKNTYDLRGNLVRNDDPDIHTTVYRYNVFGELYQLQTGRGKTIKMSYDDLGRLITKESEEGPTTYAYDNGQMATGKLVNVVSYNMSETLEYDELGRLAVSKKAVDELEYAMSYEYDGFSRIKMLTYPTGFKVENIYNQQGYQTAVLNSENGQTIWQVTAVNAKGQMLEQKYGNNVLTQQVFDPNTGLLSNIVSSLDTATIQRLAYQHNLIGNLTQRHDEKRSMVEDFVYDGLNRLLTAVNNKGGSLTMEYDELGNITYKSDVGRYTYGGNGSGPHAVTAIDGSAVPGWTLSASLAGAIEYTSFEKVKRIALDTAVVSVDYGHNNQRMKVTKELHGKIVETRLYLGGLYEKTIKNDTLIYHTHYVRGPNGVVAVYNKEETVATGSFSYWHKDLLGSLETVTGPDGTVTMSLSYDAWGRRRDPATWAVYDTYADGLHNRGFTGHEHLDLVGLIDMNGRVYDPYLGRFVSPDPFVQEFTDLQSLNRYAYVLNNPLSLVDPSGYFSIKKLFGMAEKFAPSGLGQTIVKAAKDVGNELGRFYENNKQTIHTVAAIGIGIATGGAALAMFGVTGGTLVAAVTSAAGFGFGYASSATLFAGGSAEDALKAGVKQAVISGVTAAATFGVGAMFNHETTLGNVGEKIFAHGGVQGVKSELEGGTFDQGFNSGAFTAFFTPAINTIDNPAGQLVATAVVGGTASEMSGGKFVNGAISGASIHMYNEWGTYISIGKKFARGMIKAAAGTGLVAGGVSVAAGTGGVGLVVGAGMASTGGIIAYQGAMQAKGAAVELVDQISEDYNDFFND